MLRLQDSCLFFFLARCRALFPVMRMLCLLRRGPVPGSLSGGGCIRVRIRYCRILFFLSVSSRRLFFGFLRVGLWALEGVSSVSRGRRLL